MLLWFLGTSVVAVWLVFRDPRIDYRLVMAGSVLPDAVDVWFGGARALHSLPVAAALLVVVVIATIGRRALRRHWLMLPIGVFLHLVFDGAWADAKTFWWPFSGGFSGKPLPSIERGVAGSLALEVVGACLVLWCWRRFGLSEPRRRAELVRTGQLREVVR